MPVAPAQLARLRKRAYKGGGAWLAFNPSPGLRIGGVDYSAYEVKYSANVRFAISPYSGIFRCQLDGPSATMAQVKVEQELTYSRDGVQYAGRVRSVIPTDQIVASANTTLTIECQDFTTLLDRDICAYAVSAPQTSPVRSVVESDLARIGWLLQSFGRQGVSLHHVRQGYATVPATDYTGMTLRKAVESVLAYSGESYYVDYAKDLHCFLDEGQYAPFTLSETPDNASSFPYAGLAIPADSVDLRNAIYGVPKTAGPSGLADQVTITPSANPSFATEDPVVMAIFKVAAGATLAQVGAAGAFLTGTNTTVSPAFGQATGAGHLLVAQVDSDSADATTGAAGWVQAVALRRPAGLASAIWYRPNCGAGEAAPTFTATGGLGPMTAQLLEFSGTPPSDVVDQVASGYMAANGAASVTLAAGALDAGAGELVVISSHWGWAGNVTTTFSENFSNGLTTVHVGDDGALSQNHHASHAYAIGRVTGAVARWYTDEASIALYGRQEDSFTDTTITTQADLDAKGAAALAASSQPRREGSFKCRQAGLAVGQRFILQSSLYSIPIATDPLSIIITPNPSFETGDLSAWNVGGPWAAVNDFAQSGIWSAKLTGPQTYSFLVRTPTLEVGFYKFTAWIKTDTFSFSVGAGLNIEGAPNVTAVVSILSGALAVASGTQDWTLHTLLFRVTSPGTVNLIATNSYGGTSGGTIWIDNFACARYYSGIVQGLEASWSEDEPGPLFAVEFIQPTVTLAVQLGQVVASIPAAAPTSTLGTLAYAPIVAAQNGLGNLADIAGLSITPTATAGRRVRVRGLVSYTKHTAGILTLNLMEGTTQLAQWAITAVDSGVYTAQVEATLQPAAGPHTYKLTVGVSAGTADVTASSTTPNFIIAEDVGT